MDPIKAPKGPNAKRAVAVRQNFMDKYLAGALAGNLVSFPFEVLKNRIIRGDASNTPDLFARIQTSEGMPGLYAGLIPAIMTSVIQTTVQGTIKNFFQDRIVPDVDGPSEQDPPVPPLKPSNMLWYETVSAACAGMGVSFIVSPLQIIQLALQVGSGPEYTNAWTAFVAIWEKYGLIGLYQGFLPGLIAAGLTSAASLCTYSFLKNRFISFASKSTSSVAKSDRARLERQQGRRVAQLLLSIVASGVLSSVVVMPLDAVRTRMITDTITAGPLQSFGFFEAFLRIVKDDGIFGLYRGIVAKCLRASLFGVGNFVAAWALERSLTPEK